MLEDYVVVVCNMPNRFREPAVKLPELPARSMPHQHPIVAFASSQICAAPFAEILEGLFCKVVEPPIQGVLLKLPVPRLGIEPIEPLTESRQIRA